VRQLICSLAQYYSFIAGTIHFLARDSIGHPSIRLSISLFVTRVDQSKTAEVRIIKFSPCRPIRNFIDN